MSQRESPSPADDHVPVDGSKPRSRRLRGLIVFLAILVPQLALFAPSLVGARILLPLDVLTVGTAWIAEGEPLHRDEAQDPILSDLVFVTELNRRFAVSEVRAGRLPLWSPYGYCGAPFLASNQPALFSPFRLLDYAWPGPEAIAWGQVLKALFAGLGAYFFLRRVQRVSFVAATAAASAFPLCGYMILWAGCPLSNVAAWLPWILWATDAAVRRPFALGTIGLGLATSGALLSGHAANAGHVLLTSGLFAGWRLFDLHKGRGLNSRVALLPLAALVSGWIAGFALSAPQLLPTLEYMQQSARIASRAEGEVETPPEGVVSLFQVALPYALGSREKGAATLVRTTRFEGGPAAYAGLLALLVLAPLAFAHRARRSAAVFFAVLGAFALVPLVGVPYLQSIFSLPPLLYLRNNRFTLVTAFSILVLAAFGLDALVRGHVRPRPWQWVTILVCAYLAFICAKRVVDPSSLGDSAAVVAWFRRYDSLGLATALAAIAAWFCVRRSSDAPVRLAWILSGVLVLELTINAWGVNPQCERELYYPRLQVLSEIEKREPGRMVGVDCIAPNLAQVHGLLDVRGYDAADPLRIVEVLRAGRDERAPPEIPYARTMQHVPKNPSGISDMLALRWVVLRGSPPAGEEVAFTGGGYSLFENTNALPRAYLPARVEVVPDKARRLELLGSSAFDPRAVAYVERELPLALATPARGTVKIVEDEASRVVIDMALETSGLVVLADSYDAGWKARIDGVEAPVLVTNHALRGVCVPAGARRLEFRYEPLSFAIGLWIAAFALVVMAGTAFVVRRRTTRP